MTETFSCRVGCGACCIALSISSPIPGMPEGKPAGVRCVQLDADNRCRIFGLPERPQVCVNLRPMPEMCGENAEEAIDYLTLLEQLTRPNMNQFNEIAPVDIRQNPFQTVGREWMLITAGPLDHFNMMTASWGTWGHLWERDVAICYVRPQRHTYSFMERSTTYTLNFFDDEWRKALEYCGNHSGREVDKASETGLVPFATPSGAVAFEQARLILECRKLYFGDIGESGFVDARVLDAVYQQRDFHRFYVGEITRVLSRTRSE